MTIKKRPIVCTDRDVQAILKGEKTQMRRPMKQQPPDGWTPSMGPTVLGPIARPYGKPGDRLWAKEAWGLFNDSGFCITPLTGLKQLPDYWQVAYRVDHVDPINGDGPHRPYWQRPLCMPRRASRITLEITRVRAERLQDISGPDCWAEGIASSWDCEKYGSVVECYRDMWESTHGIGSWDRNPWVWAVEFQRVEGDGVSQYLAAKMQDVTSSF